MYEIWRSDWGLVLTQQGEPHDLTHDPRRVATFEANSRKEALIIYYAYRTVLSLRELPND